MSSLDVLEREVLHSGLVTAPSGDAVRLKEPKSPMKEVVVKVENPDRTFVLRIDKAKVNGLFQRRRRQLKRCDYVIFTEIGGQRHVKVSGWSKGIEYPADSSISIAAAVVVTNEQLIGE